MNRERRMSKKHQTRQNEDDSSENEETQKITKGQIAESDKLTQTWKDINKRRSYVEKALFRAKQENLVKKFADIRNNECVSLDDMKFALEGCNDSFEKIQLRGASGREMVQDAKLMTGLATNLITQTNRTMSGDIRQFRTGQFITLLHTYLITNKRSGLFKKGNPLLQIEEKKEIDVKFDKDSPDDVPILSKSQWGRITNLFNVVPRSKSLSYLYGVFVEGSMIPREKKTKKERVKRDEKEKAVILTQRDRIDHTKNEATISKELEHVQKYLRRALEKGNGNVLYYTFVIDPTSYGRTIENIFHTSFLIKDYFARIALNRDGMPMINKLTDLEKEELRRKADNSPVQFVIKFDHKIWQTMIKALQIKEAMIPETNAQ